jgi:cytochrome c heme-lyase
MGQQMSITVAAESAINILDNSKMPANHPKLDQMPKNMEIPPECPMHQKHPPKEEKVLVSECPVQGDINPLNMMPPANQQPSPGQPFSLPTERQLSTIPRAVPSNSKYIFF